MENGCYFCDVVEQKVKADVVYEDDKILVIIADDWAVKGHCFVVWKKHAINISDLTENEYSHFSKIVYKTEKVLLQVLNRNKSIILKSGGLVQHFHFHIYPVMHNTPWQEIKDMFDMKAKYKTNKKEKEEFIKILRAGLLSVI